MKPKPTFTRLISEQEWTRTILALALLFGAVVRILPALLVNFPINDGGMFAVMIDDLIANHWLLPLETTYNYLHLPFAYPPFGIYVGAFFVSIGLTVETLFLWLPVLLSILIIPAFYFFAAEFFESRPHAATATVFLALAPGTYVWYLMGGGLTRALGAIFFLLALTFTLRAFRKLDWTSTLLAVLFCGLTLLTHPQAALLTLTGCAILWLFHGRSRAGVIRAVVIAIGAAFMSSIWWADVITQHGVNTLLSGGQSGSLYAPLLTLLKALTLRQTIIPFATIFWLLGMGWSVYKRRFDLLLLGTILFFVDQRSAPAMAFYIFSLLASYGYMDGLPSILKKTGQTEFDFSLFNRPAFSLGLLGITFYLFVECVFHTNVIVKLSLPPEARQVMTWASENTTPEASFLIVTGREDAMTDPVQEWFPVLAKRHSETTLQGMEWILADAFNSRWGALNALQSCGDAECINSHAQEMRFDYTYIIIDINEVNTESFASYPILFQNERYVVLENK
jgi:hypothetical protein